MSPRNTSISDAQRNEGRGDGESARWIAGLLMLCVGIFLLASVVFYYFDWRDDYSALYGIGSENPRFDDSIDNPCGRLGAWAAELFVGRSFGLFGAVLPLIVIMMGLRVLRRRPVVFHHSVLSSLLVLILGSLTLGIAFDDRWKMFNSGWGGDFGVEMGRLLSSGIGTVGLNAIIASLLYKKHPAQLKFVMIDPKMVEFSLYARLERHFLAKMESEEEAIITDPRKAVYTLNALCTEMENRLALCKDAAARNIKEYNEKFTARRLNPLKGHRFLPYIVVVVDEFADLIMTAKEVEGPVMRLAQKARAIGIHLIIATQRPDVKVITGGIKANFPARIAFRVMQMIDSRTIIDRPGAEQLIGRGDMLFSNNGELTRVQCALVDTPEVERIVEYISKQQGYTSAYNLPDYTPDAGAEAGVGAAGGGESGMPVKYDAKFADIARDAVAQGQISVSMIQRNYEVGFNRAGRIMMQLERAGIVGRQEGAKPRDILYHDLPSLEAKLQELGVF